MRFIIHFKSLILLSLPNFRAKIIYPKVIRHSGVFTTYGLINAYTIGLNSQQSGLGVDIKNQCL